VPAAWTHARLLPASSLAEFADSGLVIETIVEDLTASYSEDRYRLSPHLARKVFSRKSFFMPEPQPVSPSSDADAVLLLAEQTVSATMHSRAAASQRIDRQRRSVRPAYARLTMGVRTDMVHGHHICHGAYLFTLADSAFAYACNSDNRNTVASACHIDFLSPAREGELLASGDSKPGSSTRTVDLMADTVEGNPQ